MLHESSFDIQCLLDAIDQYIDAKNDHDKERDKSSGSSWGYFGHREIQRKEDAALQVKKYFNKCVDVRVEQVLKERGGQ